MCCACCPHLERSRWFPVGFSCSLFLFLSLSLSLSPLSLSLSLSLARSLAPSAFASAEQLRYIRNAITLPAYQLPLANGGVELALGSLTRRYEVRGAGLLFV